MATDVILGPDGALWPAWRSQGGLVALDHRRRRAATTPDAEGTAIAQLLVLLAAGDQAIMTMSGGLMIDRPRSQAAAPILFRSAFPRPHSSF